MEVIIYYISLVLVPLVWLVAAVVLLKAFLKINDGKPANPRDVRMIKLLALASPILWGIGIVFIEQFFAWGKGLFLVGVGILLFGISIRLLLKIESKVLANKVGIVLLLILPLALATLSYGTGVLLYLLRNARFS